MRQLSGSDALFLEQEYGNQYVHVCAFGIYDPSTAPGGFVRYKQILEFLTQRLDVSPIFRRRLVRAPLNLDRPYWLDEPAIDIEYHVRHIALPEPGDWRQLMILAARIHARSLDLTKPAWEAWVIEGLDNVPGLPTGSFALLLKIHHAAIDGESGAALVGAIHALQPVPKPREATRKVTIADREPTAVELVARTIGHRVDQTVDAAKLAVDALPLLVSAGRSKLDHLLTPTDDADDATASGHAHGVGKTAPPTRFNAKLSPHRVIATQSFPVGELDALRRLATGATLNDVFMSISSGAVRQYLQDKGELPVQSFNALMPFSTRGENKSGDVGNQVGMISIPVHSHIADPAERLDAIRKQTMVTKAQINPARNAFDARVSDLLPAPVAALVARKTLLPQVNFTLSNVRGPNVPLYMAGARLHTFMPFNVLLDGLGLSITGFSYNGILWISAVADRKMMPDPDVFSACLQSSFHEHQRAAAALAAPAAARAHKPAVATPRLRKTRERAAASTKPRQSVSRGGKPRKAPAATGASGGKRAGGARGWTRDSLYTRAKPR